MRWSIRSSVFQSIIIFKFFIYQEFITLDIIWSPLSAQRMIPYFYNIPPPPQKSILFPKIPLIFFYLFVCVKSSKMDPCYDFFIALLGNQALIGEILFFEKFNYIKGNRTVSQTWIFPLFMNKKKPWILKNKSKT